MPKFAEFDIVRFKIQSPAELAASRYEPHATPPQMENKWRSAIIYDPLKFSPERKDPPQGFVWIGVLTDDPAFIQHYLVPEAVLELVSRSDASEKTPPAAAPVRRKKS